MALNLSIRKTTRYFALCSLFESNYRSKKNHTKCKDNSFHIQKSLSWFRNERFVLRTIPKQYKA
ncbi:hypothetical protein LEP1GSC062_1724 [Leptospira alexanderi serovar Manhao 3 str. L 60]|uniref:Uncharacterized protein n=1 Tax=Leptospira alexanderi serovar Manhao 3 str. L 60 TaxID=1049759 RepID=V6HU72_9LEPT|nr:hypothetical protein LEP1GSC062_1724 [Leptospira alexanderi serovar Manhao 3 str. L 60]